MPAALPVFDAPQPATGRWGRGVAHAPSGQVPQPCGTNGARLWSVSGPCGRKPGNAHPGGDPETRRRRIVAFSRFDQTPRDIVLALAEDGKSYTRVADATSGDFEGWWRPLRQLFERAPQKLARADVVMEWPEEAEKPASSTLLRLLKKAVAKGLLLCEGSGHKGDPCRYWLLDAEMRWREDPVYQLVETQRQEWGLNFESLQEKRALMQR